METLLIVLQLIAGLGIYNVWLLRAGKKTAYRGKGAVNLRQEFIAYGLPVWMMYVVGTIKVIAATGLILGIWMPALVVPSAIVLAVMMSGAVLMHLKVSDTFTRTYPALIMLAIAVLIAYLS